MSELIGKPNDKFLKKRYAADRRFRFYGLAALALATSFLGLLLFDIVGRSLPAFTQYSVILPVQIDEDKVAEGDFDGMAKASWRAAFPTVKTRSDRNLLNSLISNAGGDQLRKLIAQDPSLVGSKVDVPVMLSDDADLFFKGKMTDIRRVVRTDKIEIKFRDGNAYVSGANLEAGTVVIASGSAFKITSATPTDAADVIIPPAVIEDYSSDNWKEISFDVPETDRKLNDRAAAWLEVFRETGRLEKQIAWNFFLKGDSREAEQAGILGSVLGSLMVVLITIVIALPLGISAAIYLEQFAPKNRITEIIEVNINNLAAVPSIIFGLLGLAVFLGFFGMPRSIPLVGGIVIALMSLPTIIIASRAAIRAVPPSILEAALGIGASHQQGVFHHVLPLAMPGIMTGTILAVASAIGETAPLLLIGMVAFIVDVPTSFTDSATVLPVQIYLWSDLPERAFEMRTAAAIVVLLVIMLILNGLAIFLRNRFERRW